MSGGGEARTTRIPIQEELGKPNAPRAIHVGAQRSACGGGEIHEADCEIVHAGDDADRDGGVHGSLHGPGRVRRQGSAEPGEQENVRGVPSCGDGGDAVVADVDADVPVHPDVAVLGRGLHGEAAVLDGGRGGDAVLLDRGDDGGVLLVLAVFRARVVGGGTAAAVFWDRAGDVCGVEVSFVEEYL